MLGYQLSQTIRLSVKHLASSNLVKFSVSLSISERWSPPLWRHYTANFVVSGREMVETATRLRDSRGGVPQFDGGPWLSTRPAYIY